MTHHLDLDALTLAKGAHDSYEEGVCLMEAVAWWADQEHTDHPRCVSPVLGTYGRSLNDVLPDGKRQLLKPFIPRMPSTAGDGLDEARSYMALDWLIRTWTPAWLDVAGFSEEAAALRDLRRIADLVAAKEAGPVVRQAAGKAAAVRDAVRAAVRAAVGAAVWDAVWAAVRDAVGDAVGDAVWDAVGAAVGDAVGDAVWDAVRDAVGAALWAAVWAAAGGAEGAAARARLAPTVAQLQDSAIALLDGMITPAENA